MNIVIIILVGIVAGYLAGLVMKGRGFGIIVNFIVGIAGAFIGDWVFDELEIIITTGWLGLLIESFIGAIILLLIISLFKKK